jgi:hypothetical protein
VPQDSKLGYQIAIKIIPCFWILWSQTGVPVHKSHFKQPCLTEPSTDAALDKMEQMDEYLCSINNGKSD